MIVSAEREFESVFPVFGSVTSSLVAACFRKNRTDIPNEINLGFATNSCDLNWCFRFLTSIGSNEGSITIFDWIEHTTRCHTRDSALYFKFRQTSDIHKISGTNISRQDQLRIVPIPLDFDFAGFYLDTLYLITLGK